MMKGVEGDILIIMMELVGEMKKSVKRITGDYVDFALEFLHDYYFVIYDKVNKTQFTKEIELIYLAKEDYNVYYLTTELNISKTTLYEHIKFIESHIAVCQELFKCLEKKKQNN